MSDAKTAYGIRIFLDLDGVVADFDTHKISQGKLRANGKTDYDKLDYAWWSTMPAFKGARKFYDELRDLAPVTFLTAPVTLKDCFAGKAQWVKDFVPEDKRVLGKIIICPRQDKQYYARPTHILVDDNEDNITEWVAAGGIGIHHKGDYKETLEAVKKEVLRKSYKPTKPTFFNDPGL